MLISRIGGAFCSEVMFKFGTWGALRGVICLTVTAPFQKAKLCILIDTCILTFSLQ